MEHDPDDQERCPICGRMNHPNAADACAHLAARTWDGQLDGVPDEAWSAWGKLQEVLDGTSWDTTRRLLTLPPWCERFGRAGLDAIAAGDDRMLFKALMKPSLGPKVATAGMLGGVGTSWYHPHGSAAWAAVAHDIASFAAALRQEA